jgi:two-component system phosphate regulon sensor histidine kinase PhoR
VNILKLPLKKSIFAKIFSGYVLITLVLSSLILVFSFQTIRHYYIHSLEDDLKNLGITVRLKIAPLLPQKNFQEMNTIVKQLGSDINTRITVIDAQGVVLADSENDPHLMENHKTRPEMAQALQGGTGTSVRYSATVKEEMLYVAVPVEQGDIIGAVRASLFLEDINNLLAELKLKIAQAALIILGISLIGAGVFSRSLSKPIRELSAAARRTAARDFSVRVFLKNRDELKDLADSFNYMNSEISALVNELSNHKDKLKGIISSIQEGLAVFDREGKIVLSNESFKTMIQEENVEGRFYWEVLRIPAFGELIKRVLREKKNWVEEIELYDKVFLCSATFLEARKEVVAIFHDITASKRVEKIKKDFVVNVSHELRTPLTAVKGFVETLEEQVDEESLRYVEIIKRHTDRLIHIVQDLLALSELEESGVTLELEDVDVSDVLESVLGIFEQKLIEKGLELKCEIDPDLPSMKGDPFKLEQMFINLIDNAINYTEKGSIAISIGRKDNRIMIQVRDTGNGIPGDDLPRIFERFYVVDKSRSRRLGGTGLGLSIVKHIVLLHNGTIDVKSMPGTGTIFSISFPFSLS